MAQSIIKKEILEKLENIAKMISSAASELEDVKQRVQSLDDSVIISDKPSLPPFAEVPAYITGYTLDDLYKAFGKKKKSYVARLKAAIKENDIRTLEDFLSLTPGELLKLNNIGYKTLTHTRKALEKLGIDW